MRVFWFAAVIMACSSSLVNGQTASEERIEFSSQFSDRLFGAENPVLNLGEGVGARIFLLAQTGSTISPISEAYSGVQGDLTQSLAEAVVFDRTVMSSDGFAIMKEESLSDVWRKIIDASRPGFSLIRDRALDTQTMKWLFRPSQKRDSGRTIYTREASTYYSRYLDFEARYLLLLSARQSDVWRAIPEFTRYASFESAERSLLNEWFKSGYKSEIESAMWRFAATVPVSEWQNWAKANETFEANMIPYGPYLTLPVTRLIPPPASWSSVSIWYRASASGGRAGGEYKFQFARVNVVRPWLKLDSLLSGMIRPGIGDRPTLMVSDGVFNNGQVPGGVMGGFIEEIILVRNISYSGSDSNNMFEHPLGRYAYPDAINILGFVVRVLPEIPPKYIGDDVAVSSQLDEP